MGSINYKGLIDIKYCVKRDKLNISHKLLNNGDIITAFYVYHLKNNSERVVVYKNMYKSRLDNHYVQLQSGRYQLKFFFKKKCDSSYTDSILSPLIDVSILDNFLPQLFKESSLTIPLNSLIETGLNDIDFGTVMQFKHGMFQHPPNFFNDFSKEALSLLFAKPHNISTTKFLLNTIFYLSDSDFLDLNKEKLVAFLILHCENQSMVDIFFWFGVMEYKLSNYLISYQAFSKLLKFKNDLKFYQTGCISYLHTLPLLDSEETFLDNVIFNNKYILSSKVGGCILISCDYGYYSVYVKERLSIINSDCLVHLHLILSDHEVCKIKEDLTKLSNVNYSYEIVSKDIGNFKTYCSIARYLILDLALVTYDLPVLIADADLDFEKLDLKTVFSKVGFNDIFLRMKHAESELPWLKVLAGFNLFGVKTFESSLVKNIKKYLIYCYNSGRDGWMLDQVALSQCVYFNELEGNEDCNVMNLDDHIKLDVNQVRDRNKKKLARSYSG